MSNRLPSFAKIGKDGKAGKSGSYTAHLVSLEGRYDKQQQFDWSLPAHSSDDDYIPLISLFSWRFACLETQHTFTGLIKNLDCTPFYLPSQPGFAAKPIPGNPEALAEKYRSAGLVPLPHAFRDGERSISWYHGPFLPDQPKLMVPGPPLSAQRSDELLGYDQGTEMLDVSYSAAWTLGRMLMLKNTSVAMSLYRWKRRVKLAFEAKKQAADYSHLPGIQKPVSNQLSKDEANAPANSQDKIPVPADVSAFFNQLKRLQGLPFTHLVPNDDLLPSESIRLFWIDPVWIRSLVDGAFSIGRVTSSDRVRELEDESGLLNIYPDSLKERDKITGLSGFILRSTVVTQWPDLQVAACAVPPEDEKPIPPKNRLELLQMERLAPDILLVIFVLRDNPTIKAFDLEKKRESLHAGFSVNEEGNGFYKQLRSYSDLSVDKKGNEQSQKKETNLTDKTIYLTDLLWRKKDYHIINLNQLSVQIDSQMRLPNSPPDPAFFASQLIEGVESVRFNLAHS